MPTVNLFTNVSSVPDKKELIKTLSVTASKAIGKPEQYFSIILHLDQDLIFGGSFDPAAYAEISSIGAIGGEKNKTIVKDITAVVNEHLGVPSDRFYVKFHDIKASDWGWKGTTFDEFLPK